MSELPDTYKAVKLYLPSRDIRVEDVPKPEISNPDDAIVRIELAGLCGSDLHCYRGNEPFSGPFICGHEFVGRVVALGTSFLSANASANVSGRPELYSTLSLGDRVISPFTSSCSECQACRLGFFCRCTHARLFGTPTLPGGQAQYIVVPHAGGTLSKAPTDPSLPLGTIPEFALLLLADILPTGYFAALQVLNHPNILPCLTARPFPQLSPLLQDVVYAFWQPAFGAEDASLDIAVVGLGPVGVCALIALLDFLFPDGKTRLGPSTPRIVGIDPLPLRRTRAQQIISEYWSNVSVEFVAPEDAPEDTFNGVLEVVGSNNALALSYKLIKPFGVISSVGVHNNEKDLPFSGGLMYDKNVSLSFGRCPVRALMPLATDLLLRRRDIFTAIGTETALVERIVPLSEAREAYEKFDKGIWGKVLFDPWK
ncbi:hypothetical protein EXIGLDRAFT_722579 [Exidia glandulosa HHB12029]|uniref:Alcohol dehydrogenase-like N-terminal domain-containing protein n=1 Tax=Exidia glandulosa HHB12029 TaxID=1314781 RepID=A0A166A5C4_EXIGL|nr:hypothetical protein EXIGLDRAFT_722579 [Exidia glandulosa HHB12029]